MLPVGMEKAVCCVCQKPKASLTCGICQSTVCKYCAQFTDEETFAFLPQKPAFLQQDTFCGPCFTEQVAPELNAYENFMNLAKDVLVYAKNQSKESRLLSRKEEPLQVLGCTDENETILRLAFLAAKAGFNGLVDVNVSGQKVRQGTYQTTIWSGTGIPTQIESKKIIRDRSFTHYPN